MDEGARSFDEGRRSFDNERGARDAEPGSAHGASVGSKAESCESKLCESKLESKQAAKLLLSCCESKQISESTVLLDRLVRS